MWFDLHFPVISDVEHLFMCLLTTCLSSLETYLFSSAYFSVGLLGFGVKLYELFCVFVFLIFIIYLYCKYRILVIGPPGKSELFVCFGY